MDSNLHGCSTLDPGLAKSLCAYSHPFTSNVSHLHRLPFLLQMRPGDLLLLMTTFTGSNEHHNQFLNKPHIFLLNPVHPDQALVLRTSLASSLVRTLEPSMTLHNFSLLVGIHNIRNSQSRGDRRTGYNHRVKHPTSSLPSTTTHLQCRNYPRLISPLFTHYPASCTSHCSYFCHSSTVHGLIKYFSVSA